MTWWLNNPDFRAWFGTLMHTVTPPYVAGLPTPVMRKWNLVEVPEETDARAECVLVKVGTDTTPSEYDLMLYIHAGTVEPQ